MFYNCRKCDEKEIEQRRSIEILMGGSGAKVLNNCDSSLAGAAAVSLCCSASFFTTKTVLHSICHSLCLLNNSKCAFLHLYHSAIVIIIWSLMCVSVGEEGGMVNELFV